jgi:NADH-quinone oxidoreductase subunit J
VMLPVLAQSGATSPSSAELVVFIIVGALSIGSAVSMVLMRNTVHAALMLVVNFFTIAVFYAVQEAQFLATVQIIVYAGAIMVLFLFVIMLLGVDREDPEKRGLPGQRASGLVLGVVLFAALAVGVGGPFLSSQSACPTPPPAEGAPAGEGIPCRGLAAANDGGNTQGVGALLFTRYVWPFEVISVLLVIAAIGAMVLGRRSEDPLDLIDVGHPDLEPVVEPEEPEKPEPAVIGKGNPAPSSDLTQEDS